jgi:hypothetical protein
VSQRIKLLSVKLLVLAMVVGTQYIRAAVRYHEASDIIASTMSISPDELTVLAGALPNTPIDSYF